MAFSLRDRLKAADSSKPSQAPKHPSGLVTKDTHYSLSEFPHLAGITNETLSLMESLTLATPFDPRRVLYLDTETTGLATGAGTVAFLIGVGYMEGDGFTVRQFIMRDYCDEHAMLTQLSTLMSTFDIIVTFNGKSYDLTLLQTRFLMNRLDPSCLDMPHVDLLHIARRIFKLRLKKCKLTHLETALWGAPRTDDLPGALIPERFFLYLKTGEFALLDDILLHNAQDVASLMRLLAHMVYMYDHPETVTQSKDVYSIGVSLEKRREHHKARHCYHLAANGDMRALSHEKLANSFKREKDLPSAKRLYEQMIHLKEGGILPYVELAKIHEHRLHDIDAALYYTRHAMILLSEPTVFSDTTVQESRNALQYRYDRLKRKQRTREIY